MELKLWIEKFGKEEAALLAREAGTNYAYLSQIAFGHRQASPKLATKIAAATRGAVTREEIRPDVYGPPASTPSSEPAPAAA